MTHPNDHMSTVNWAIDPGDDPVVAGYVQGLVVAAASLSGLRKILVVHIDNWFGEGWLGFQGKIVGAVGVHTKTTAEEPEYSIPPFHPNRVLSERCFELSEEGLLLGPFESSTQLHDQRSSEENIRLSFNKMCEPGVYAWYSGNTKANDRASLMVYTHSNDGTDAWYVEFQRTGGWRLSRRIGVGDTEWHKLLENGGILELR